MSTHIEKSPAPPALPHQRIAFSSRLSLPGVRVAVIAHIFYPDLVDEIRSSLKHIVEPFDLIITTPYENDVPSIFAAFSSLASGVAIAVSENRGRDVGPFMAVYRKKMLDHYDAVLKLHTKKSLYDTARGSSWRRGMFSQLCGNSKITRRSIALLREGHAGIVGPRTYHISHPEHWYWGSNRETVHRLLQSVISRPLDGDALLLSFFSGTMFWFAPGAFSALHEMPEHMLAFESEKGQLDGTLAHALERVFGMLPSFSGYRLASLVPARQDFDVMFY